MKLAELQELCSHIQSIEVPPPTNMDDFADSSLDGSLNEDSYTSGTPEPALNLPHSPESVFNMDFSATVPRLRDSTNKLFGQQFEEESHQSDHYEPEEVYESDYEEPDSVHLSDAHASNFTQDISESFHLNVSTDLASTPILSNCNKISSFLSENGYDSVNLLSSDIDRKTGMISTFVIDSWAETILTAIMEMQERVQSNRQAMGRVSLSSKQSEAGQEAQTHRVEELRAKLQAADVREKSALAKIALLEEGMSQKSKTSDSGTAEHRRLVKNMETQLQELERRGRTKDLEIERLKQKLAHVAEKERETNARNRHIVSQIKSGDVSFVNDNLQVSSLNKVDSPTHISSSSHNARTSSGASSSAAHNSSFASSSAPGRGVHSSGAKPRTPSKMQRSPNASFTSASGASANVVSLTAVVDALESQRRELGARNKELELQVRDLLAALKKQANEHAAVSASKRSNEEEVQARKSSEAHSHTLSLTAQSMYLRIQQQEAEIEALQRQLELKAALLQEREEIIVGQRNRTGELHTELENLRLQLDGRPTMRQWTQAQRDREQLEEKLHDLILLRGEAAEISMWRQHLSTADRIKVDKRNHELGLWLLDSLPKATMKEVLQTVCRELDITEISEIHPSLVKLKAVVKTVPRMERFISQVCNFVFQRHPSLGPIDGLSSAVAGGGGGDGVPAPSVGADGQSVYSMEHLLPILRRWWYAAQRCVELDTFHSRVSMELFRKQELLARRSAQHTLMSTGSAAAGGAGGALSTAALQKADFGTLQRLWQSEGRALWATRDPESVFQIVRDLVDFQVEVMHHDQSLLYAENYILERPEILVNRIVGHIQYLFEIKTLDGVLPRLNQVYLFVEEMRNFLKASRALVDARGYSSEAMGNNSMLLAEILRRLSAGSSVGVTSKSIIQ